MEHFLGASYYILGAGDTAGNQADKGPAFLECRVLLREGESKHICNFSGGDSVMGNRTGGVAH